MNFVERILRLKKKDLEAMEHVGTLILMILSQVSNVIQNRELDANTYMQEPKTQEDSSPK